MFLGEFLCLVAYRVFLFGKFVNKKLRGNNADAEETQAIIDAERNASIQQDKKKTTKKFNPFIFLLPAMCDLSGTTIMNYGLMMTYASVYQMLRGMLVVFTAIFSVIFLKRRLMWRHWFGILFVVAGTALVGLSSVLYSDGNSSASMPWRRTLIGDALVVGAQVIAATQMVVEEKFLSKYDVHALQCVGWEGFWGFTVVLLLLIIFQFVPGSQCGSFENSIDAFIQLKNNHVLILAVLGSIFSIAFFNFFGITITKRINSATRATIDSCRTLFIWAISLIIKWEKFHWLQVLGFVILVFGTFLYNEVIRVSFACFIDSDKKEEEKAQQQRQVTHDEEDTYGRYGTVDGGDYRDDNNKYAFVKKVFPPQQTGLYPDADNNGNYQ
eukprot:GEZU01020184.1.p1 GENE.GEZU01020184.1~~GEZU01020184.1.p1  ORF type:complete len:383 (-),score=161.30 GEZU01020184.1:83-1231(-)